jgi:hypothetical protein
MNGAVRGRGATKTLGSFRYETLQFAVRIYERTTVFASNYPVGDVFLSTLYFVLLIFWIILVFHVVLDIFRSHDLSGPAKALWLLFIFVLPLLGTLLYVLIRGGSMHERQVQTVQAQQKAFEDYIRQVANTKE